MRYQSFCCSVAEEKEKILVWWSVTDPMLKGNLEFQSSIFFQILIIILLDAHSSSTRVQKNDFETTQCCGIERG